MKEKKISVALAAMLAALPLTACGGGNQGNGDLPVDPDTTTIINVLNYDCGYGKTYIEETKKAFEEAVKDVSYEPNKKGVYINIESFATGTTGQDVLNSLPTSTYDMFFSDGHTGEAMKRAEHAMDLTKFLKATSADETKVSEFVESKSIYDRMYPDFRDYVTASDEKIYSVPLFASTYNFTYDKDLVVEKGLYIRSDSTDTELKLTNDVTKGCLGVDGVKGTADDGLPETYAQFYLWLDEVYDAGCIPLHFQGGMLKSTFVNWWADFEGKDNVKACWSFDGTVMTDLIEEVDANGNVVKYHEPTEITFANGPMVQKQEGRYRALEVMHYLANSMKGSKKLMHTKCFTENHREAQGTYVMSKFDKQPIMLFAEGGYWEAEASAVFSGLENKKSGKMDRNFAVLPVPRYNREDVGGDDYRRTVPVTLGGDMFIRKEVENQANYQAVIDFLMYFNTEAQMAVSNREASQPRPFEYSIEGVELSNYQKSLYNLMHDAKTDLVFKSANNDLVVAYPEQLNTSYYWGFYSRYKRGVSDDASYEATKIFYDYGVSVNDYFYGMYEYYTYKPNANTKSKWEQMLETVGL